jgi:class 3 adenylate cyclase
MHRDLRALLPQAKGVSHFVVAVFLDVRGFSSFAKKTESVEAAVFLRRMYLRILDEYFNDVSFFKPTGDGLMIILDYQDEETLTGIVRYAVKRSLDLVRDFPTLTSNDPMVNFDVPTELGVGIARGAATSLVSGEKILDYSGKPLNMAARLMDLARPRGVVFSADLGLDLLEKEEKEAFKQDLVYIKGINDETPLEVFYLDGETEIPDVNRRPLTNRAPIIQELLIEPFSKIKQRAPGFRHGLQSTPSDKGRIKVYVRYPAKTAGGRQQKGVFHTYVGKGEYNMTAGKEYVVVDYGTIVERLEARGVKGTWEVRVIAEYLD